MHTLETSSPQGTATAAATPIHATTTTDDSVESPLSAWRDMAEHWEAPDALMGGTLRMRNEGEKWLPKEDGEHVHEYNARLQRSILFEGYQDALARIISKPFRRPITVTEKELLPAKIAPILDDADLRDRSLTQFAKMFFRSALHRGLAHILVDGARGFRDDGTPITHGDELFRGARPRFVFVDASALRKWFFVEDQAGNPILDRIYIHKKSTVPDGDHGEAMTNSIQVWTRTEIVDFQQNDKGDFVEMERATHSFTDASGNPSIPLVTFYTNRQWDMVGYPPLEGLGWLNMVHWQSMSDQRNLLRIARVPKPYTKGDSIDAVENGEKLPWGVSRIHRSANEAFEIAFAEVKADGAIAAGVADLEDLEAKMERLGMRPFLQPRTTATANRIDEDESHSDVESWIRGLENVLLDALQMAGRWVNEEIPEDVRVDVFSDFGLGMRTEMDLDHLIKARMARELPRENYLREIQKRGVIGEDEDIEEIMAKLDEEFGGEPDGGVGDEFDRADGARQREAEIAGAV